MSFLTSLFEDAEARGAERARKRIRRAQAKTLAVLRTFDEFFELEEAVKVLDKSTRKAKR